MIDKSWDSSLYSYPSASTDFVMFIGAIIRQHHFVSCRWWVVLDKCSLPVVQCVEARREYLAVHIIIMGGNRNAQVDQTSGMPKHADMDMQQDVYMYIIRAVCVRDSVLKNVYVDIPTMCL